MSKPKVTDRPNADRYAAENERIIEVSEETCGLGCLISIKVRDGKLVVGVYSADEGVEIEAESHVVVRGGTR